MDSNSLLMSTALTGSGASNLGAGLTSTSGSNPLVSSPDAGSVNSGGAGGAFKGADFADLFAQIMVDSSRQNLAAGTGPASPKLLSAGLANLPSGLTTIPLGPQLQLVTAAKPLPDGSSLLAFARSQGLDESTVSSLFSELAPKISASAQSNQGGGMAPLADFAGLPALQTSVSAAAASAPTIAWDALSSSASSMLGASTPSNALPDSSLKPSNGLIPMPAEMAQAMQALQADIHWQMGGSSNNTSTSNTSNSTQSPAPSGSASTPQVALPANPLPATDALQLSGISVGAAPSLPNSAGAMRWGNPVPTPTPVPTPASPNLSPVVAGSLAVLPSVPLSPSPSSGSEAGLTDLSHVTDANNQVTPDTVDRTQALSQPSPQITPPAADMVSTLRLQLQPVEAVTQKLATLANQGEGNPWGSLTGYTQGEGAILDLSLGSPMPGEAMAGKGANNGHAPGFSDTLTALASLGNTASDSGAAVSGMASTQSVNTAAAADSAKPAFSEQMAISQQNYQQMSDKLGQALASRLQDQIQSGQWKMQMDVVPAHLGKISIDLNMHSGGLDATFKSDNAATRDLIVAGMPTLRHNLNQTGTTVASVWVNADARGQSGGNPTPGQGRQTTPEPKEDPENADDPSDLSMASMGDVGEAGWSLMA